MLMFMTLILPWKKVKSIVRLHTRKTRRLQERGREKERAKVAGIGRIHCKEGGHI